MHAFQNLGDTRAYKHATSCNGIHMFCLIQTHIHTDTPNMKSLINKKINKTSS